MFDGVVPSIMCWMTPLIGVCSSIVCFGCVEMSDAQASVFSKSVFCHCPLQPSFLVFGASQLELHSLVLVCWGLVLVDLVPC